MNTTTNIAPPNISEDIWGDTPELTYWTIRYYNPTGFGLEKEWTNIPAADEQDAKWYAQGKLSIAQGNMYRVVATKQDKRVF